MDISRAIEKVDELLGWVDQSYTLWQEGDHETRRLADEQIIAQLPMIRRIAAASGEQNTSFQKSIRGWPWVFVRESAVALRGFLAGQAELEEILGPQGPRLSAERLHPWVWEAAASLWSDGYRREAVQAAATQVETHLRAKLERTEGTGVKLCRDGFSLNDPAPDRLRLRLPRFNSGESFSNAHEGAAHFGAGCFMAIRNIVSHNPEQPDEQLALEQLAALSLLARWIDEALVVRP